MADLKDKDEDNEATFGMLLPNVSGVLEESTEALDAETFGAGNFDFSDRDTLLSEFDRLAERSAQMEDSNAFMFRTHEDAEDLPRVGAQGEIARSKTGQDVLPQDDLRSLLTSAYDFVDAEALGSAGMELPDSLFGFLNSEEQGLAMDISPPSGEGPVGPVSSFLSGLPDVPEPAHVFATPVDLSVEPMEPQPAPVETPLTPQEPSGDTSSAVSDGSDPSPTEKPAEPALLKDDAGSFIKDLSQLEWMTRSDVVRVLKIQMSTLLPQTNLDDDAYTTEIAQRRGLVVPPPTTSPADLIRKTHKHMQGAPLTTSLLTSSEGETDEGSGLTNRNATSALAKSLGALQFSSIRQPRQMLSLSSARTARLQEEEDTEESEEDAASGVAEVAEDGMFDGRTLQYLVEEGLRELIVVEDVDRMLRHVDMQLRYPPRNLLMYPEAARKRHAELTAEHAKLLRQRQHLTNRLCFQLDMYDDETDEPVALDADHTVFLFLSIPKGRLLLYRSLLVLPAPASLQLATALLQNCSEWLQPEIWSELCDPFLPRALVRTLGKMDMPGINHAFHRLLYSQDNLDHAASLETPEVAQHPDLLLQAWIRRVLRSQSGSAAMTVILQRGFLCVQQYRSNSAAAAHFEAGIQAAEAQKQQPHPEQARRLATAQQLVSVHREQFEIWRSLHDTMLEALQFQETAPGEGLASLLEGLKSRPQSDQHPQPKQQTDGESGSRVQASADTEGLALIPADLEGKEEHRFVGLDNEPAEERRAYLERETELASQEALWVLLSWIILHNSQRVALWSPQLKPKWEASGKEILQNLLEAPAPPVPGPNGAPMPPPPAPQYAAAWQALSPDQPVPRHNPPRWFKQGPPHQSGGHSGRHPGHHPQHGHQRGRYPQHPQHPQPQHPQQHRQHPRYSALQHRHHQQNRHQHRQPYPQHASGRHPAGPRRGVPQPQQQQPQQQQQQPQQQSSGAHSWSQRMSN